MTWGCDEAMPQRTVLAHVSFPHAVAGVSGTKGRPREAPGRATTTQLGSEASEAWEGRTGFEGKEDGGVTRYTGSSQAACETQGQLAVCHSCAFQPRADILPWWPFFQ